MTDEPPNQLDKVLKAGGTARSAWELAALIVSAGSGILAFITDIGGPDQFLVEVAFIGFAAYVALFFVVTPIVALVAGAERATDRETTDEAWRVVLAVAAVGGAALVRFGLFADDVTQDLDGIGTAFGVVVGVAILASPAALWWYHKGSRKATDDP